MAKSNKQTPKTAASSAANNTRRASIKEATDYLLRPALPQRNPLMDKIFWGIAAIGLLVLLVLSFGSGINADDKFQVDYSQKLVQYYSTFGQDTAALNIPDGNMHLYGGFFETITGFTNKIAGF